MFLYLVSTSNIHLIFCLPSGGLSLVNIDFFQKQKQRIWTLRCIFLMQQILTGAIFLYTCVRKHSASLPFSLSMLCVPSIQCIAQLNVSPIKEIATYTIVLHFENINIVLVVQRVFDFNFVLHIQCHIHVCTLHQNCLSTLLQDMCKNHCFICQLTLFYTNTF